MSGFDSRTAGERRRDAKEAAMTLPERIARHETLLARAAAANVKRPDLEAELAALRRRRK